MRLYLDNCCLQRPLDDQTQPRIRVESEAVFAVLATIQAGQHSLLSSEALEFEIFRIPDETRRNEVLEILALASEHLVLNDGVEALAQTFEESGLGQHGTPAFPKQKANKKPAASGLKTAGFFSLSLKHGFIIILKTQRIQPQARRIKSFSLPLILA